VADSAQKQAELLSCKGWNIKVLQSSHDFAWTQHWLCQALPIFFWHLRSS
jgi:hypothetical protein